MTGASGIGLATIAADGSVLDTWFPAPELGGDGASGTNRLSVAEVPEDLAALAERDEARDVETVLVRTTIASLDEKPADAYDAYLRLHLLSHRLVAPHGANLDGIFGLLANVVWTNVGPCAVDGFETTRARLRATRPGRRCTASTSSRGWSTTWCRPACGSPTPTGCGWARIWRRAPP